MKRQLDELHEQIDRDRKSHQDRLEKQQQYFQEQHDQLLVSLNGTKADQDHLKDHVAALGRIVNTLQRERSRTPQSEDPDGEETTRPNGKGPIGKGPIGEGKGPVTENAAEGAKHPIGKGPFDSKSRMAQVYNIAPRTYEVIKLPCNHPILLKCPDALQYLDDNADKSDRDGTKWFTFPNNPTFTKFCFKVKGDIGKLMTKENPEKVVRVGDTLAFIATFRNEEVCKDVFAILTSADQMPKPTRSGSKICFDAIKTSKTKSRTQLMGVSYKGKKWCIAKLYAQIVQGKYNEPRSHAVCGAGPSESLERAVLRYILFRAVFTALGLTPSVEGAEGDEEEEEDEHPRGKDKGRIEE